MSKILVAEDDAITRRGIVLSLSQEALEVLETDSGPGVLELVSAGCPDVIVLDVKLRGLSGFEVCRKLRQAGQRVPIIFLSGLIEEEDRVRGLEVGGDDYMVKPFGMRELQARIHLQLRRQHQASAPPVHYRFGTIEINFEKHEARRKGRRLDLTPREFEILRYFVQRRSEVVSRSELLQAVWKLSPETVTRTVDMHLVKLREKLESDPNHPRFLISIWGQGYKFIG